MNLIASRGQLRASFLRWALFLVPAIVLLGFLSGNVAGSGPGNPWFDALVKPSIYPPPALFGIVWTILYVMMGLAVVMVVVARGARGRTAALILFAIQFLLNLAWTPVFFAAHQITGALAVIAVLDLVLIATIVLFWRVRPLAGALLLPYLAWVLFATALNYQFLQLNPQADGQNAPNNAVERIEL